MKSESCIFCNSKDNLTIEHIIPESISKKKSTWLSTLCVKIVIIN